MLPLDGEVDSWQVDNILFLFPIHTNAYPTEYKE